MRDSSLLKAKILIIDDEAHDVEILRRMLEQAGYEALESTTDSLTALGLFGEFKPDLVVLDWRMPGLSGADVLASIRAIIPADAHLPILVVTGDPMIETRRLALSRGANDIVAKPYDSIEILARIRNLLEARFLARKNTEDAMREGELRFFDTFEHAPLGVALVSPDGRWLKVNRALCDLMGYTQAELLARTFQDITHPEDLAVSLENVRRTISGESRSYQVEKRYVHARGHPVTVMLNATLVRDGRGEPRYFISQIQDVTEQRCAEEKLQRQQIELQVLNAHLEERVAQRTEDLFLVTQEAELANRAKSEFLSRTSHELRTPMNAILGFGQLLEMEPNLGPEVRESVAHILDAGRHLLALIDEVLDISNAESGAMTLELEPVLVAPMVEDTLQRVQSLGATFRIELELRLPAEGSWWVLANAQRLQQVLQNLLSNAIQYNRPGGKVVLECVPIEWPDAPAFRFSVRDTGPGISAENISRLFMPFDRLDAERIRTHVAGSGLALAVSKRLVELMGGRVGVESVVGEGSTFWVEVPRAEGVIATRKQPALPALPRAGRRRIPEAENLTPETAKSRALLYIEDNQSNIRLMTRILNRRPAVQLHSATTGALGLQLAREYLPDLILLDLRLSDMNGDQVLAGLGTDARTSGIPVVILTADGESGKREKMIAAGARAFFTKPVDVPTLLGVLDEFLEVPPAEPA